MNSATPQPTPAARKNPASNGKKTRSSLRWMWVPLVTAAIGAAVDEPRSVAAAVGFAVGIVLVVLLGLRGDRIKSPSAVLGLFSEPILGQIPVAPEARGSGGVPLLQHADTRVKYAEAFRSLRSSLLFMGYDGRARSLLVTGTAVGEGTSVVASNLAVTMALSGTKTLLIDANLGGASVGKIFRVDHRNGLANVLSGQTTLEAALQQTSVPNLAVLTSGDSNTSSGAEASAVHNIVQQALSLYEMVLIDAPPVANSPMTAELASQVAGTLVVIRRNVTPARRVKKALGVLRQHQVNILGFVLNCIDPDSSEFSYNQSTR